MSKDVFLDLKKNISKEKKILKELVNLSENLERSEDGKERESVNSQINLLKDSLKKENENLGKLTEGISLIKPLGFKKEKEESISYKNRLKKSPEKKEEKENITYYLKKIKISDLEKDFLKRLRKKEKKKVEKKRRKINFYVQTASRFFSSYSRNMLNKGLFKTIRTDLMRASISVPPTSYVSMIIFTTVLSVIFSIFLFLFLLFFNITLFPPSIGTVVNIGGKFLSIFWILIVIPLLSFAVMYIYPSLEKKSREVGINRELPFATIHMSAISGSLIDPTKIFNIIISTKEYPNLEKEFKKLINEINIYGYDLVTALRNATFRSPSKKLIELFNGLATTITSGGDLANFFEKRSETLLLEHRLEREKYTKTTETFMDVYISVVIAAPMIFMLLLMMIQISGLGISFSTSTITLLLVFGVAIINVIFLAFLHLKQPVE